MFPLTGKSDDAHRAAPAPSCLQGIHMTSIRILALSIAWVVIASASCFGPGLVQVPVTFS